MNKKKFARIMSMYRDGVTERVCIESIMDMSTSHTQAATWIDKFHIKIIDSVLKELVTLRHDLKEVKTDIKNGFYAIGGEKDVKQSDPEESTNLEDK